MEEAFEMMGSVDLDNSIFRKQGNPVEAFNIIKNGYTDLEDEIVRLQDVIIKKNQQLGER